MTSFSSPGGVLLGLTTSVVGTKKLRRADVEERLGGHTVRAGVRVQLTLDLL